MSEYDKLLEQLGISTAPEDQVPLPSPGGEFAAGSFIAPWTAEMLWSFMTDEDYASFFEQGTPRATYCIPRGDTWAALYYRDYTAAKQACSDIVPPSDQVKEPKPSLFWCLFADTNEVLNRDPEQLKEGFGDILFFDIPCQAARMGSERFPMKRRHEYNLLALPSAVAAYSRIAGTPNAVFDLSELTEVHEGDWTDEYFTSLVGNLEGDYRESVFWQRRAELWKLLGEEDAEKCAPKGAVTARGKPNKQATTSDKLSAALSIVAGKWKKPIWCQLTRVNNPLPGAANSSGRQFTVPCITEIYLSREDALSAANEEREERGDEQIDADKPPVPENYRGYEDSLIKAVKEFRGPPAKIKDVLFMEPAEYSAWDVYIKAKGL